MMQNISIWIIKKIVFRVHTKKGWIENNKKFSKKEFETVIL